MRMLIAWLSRAATRSPLSWQQLATNSVWRVTQKHFVLRFDFGLSSFCFPQNPTFQIPVRSGVQEPHVCQKFIRVSERVEERKGLVFLYNRGSLPPFKTEEDLFWQFEFLCPLQRQINVLILPKATDKLGDFIRQLRLILMASEDC